MQFFIQVSARFIIHIRHTSGIHNHVIDDVIPIPVTLTVVSTRTTWPVFDPEFGSGSWPEGRDRPPEVVTVIVLTPPLFIIFWPLSPLAKSELMVNTPWLPMLVEARSSSVFTWLLMPLILLFSSVPSTPLAAAYALVPVLVSAKPAAALAPDEELSAIWPLFPCSALTNVASLGLNVLEALAPTSCACAEASVPVCWPGEPTIPEADVWKVCDEPLMPVWPLKPPPLTPPTRQNIM